MKISLSIAKKMFIIGIIVFVGLSVLGGNSYLTNNKIEKVTQETSGRNQELEVVRGMQQALLKIMVAAMDSIVDKDEGKVNPERMQIINTNIKFLQDNLVSLESLADHEDEKVLVKKIASNLPVFAKGVQVDLVSLVESKAADEEFAKFDNIADENGEAIQTNLTAIAAAVLAEQKEADEAENHMIAQSTLLSLITWLLTIAVCMPVIFLIARSIIKPIRRAIEGLNEGAEQVASAAGQVSSSSQGLAEGSSEQAAAIEETSSSLEEMAAMTKQNADHATQADSLMQESNGVIKKANSSMVELTTSMEEISKASEETQKIVKTIDEIAFQTNLLALNAAVEAARAGEAGAGFAVVADEVRNLAMRAADAAKNTSGLIEGTVRKITDGSELVTRTNEAFSEVTDSSTKVGELVSEISAASNEQAQGIEQVNSAVADMDKVTQQNAANAEESASASEEMSAQAEEMKNMVTGLVALVEGTGHSRNLNIRRRHPEMKEIVHKQTAIMPAKITARPRKNTTAEELIPFDDGDFKDF